MANDVNTPDPVDALENTVSTPQESATPSDVTAIEGDRATVTSNTPTETPDAPPATSEDAPASESAEMPKAEVAPQATDKKTAEAPQEAPKKKRRKKKKPAGPTPAQALQRIGNTTEEAMAYVASPEAQWQKLSSGFLEELITELPPLTAAALLGPEALCRHFLASAATGRYRDLFNLWDLFKTYPEQCKPILMSRTEAQERAKHKLRVATEFGLIGSADRVAEDIDRAQGLPWNWIRDILKEVGPLIAQRPVVIAALWRKDPSWPIDLPDQPDQRWLSEAAALHNHADPVPEAIDNVLGQHLESLPTTPSTLGLAAHHHPDQVPVLLDRLDPEAEDLVATVRWARDHGYDLTERLFAHLDQIAKESRAKAAAMWAHWRAGGVAPQQLPESLMVPTMDGLDLGAPESWDLAAILVKNGATIDAQAIVDQAASTNRQVGEKAYEAAVCAGFNEVHLPAGLASNPNIKPDARCPKCAAWTWVRPKHETRCPRSAGDIDVPVEVASATDQADKPATAGQADSPA